MARVQVGKPTSICKFPMDFRLYIKTIKFKGVNYGFVVPVYRLKSYNAAKVDSVKGQYYFMDHL